MTRYSSKGATNKPISNAEWDSRWRHPKTIHKTDSWTIAELIRHRMGGTGTIKASKFLGHKTGFYHTYRGMNDGKTESFQAPRRWEWDELVVVAEGKMARIFNTKTGEYSEVMTRAEAIERVAPPETI